MWLVGASGGIVVIEPAPYEFVVVLAMVVFMATGMPLRRAHIPLVLLLIAYNIGYLIGVVPVLTEEGTVMWTAVSSFMSVTTLFFALALTEDTERRLDLLLKGYLAIAVGVYHIRHRHLFSPAARFRPVPARQPFARDLQGPQRARRLPGAALPARPAANHDGAAARFPDRRRDVVGAGDRTAAGVLPPAPGARSRLPPS